jgi:MFS family permease
MSGYSGNLKKMYALKFFTSFWLIVPVMIPYYQANGLNATQVLVIQAVFNIFMLLFDVPTGYVSDIAGRRLSIILAAFILPVGLAVYAVTKGFWAFFTAEVILAFAWSLRSGTDSALVYETLKAEKKEKSYSRFEGRSNFFERIGDASASVLGGLLGMISLRLPFVVNIFTSMIMIPIAFSIREPKRAKSLKKDHVREIGKIVKYVITHPEIGSLVLYFSLLFGVSVTGVWSYFMYYKKLGLSVVWFGVLQAAFGLACAAGSVYAHNVEKFIGKKASLYVLTLMAPVFMLLGFIQSVWMFPVILLNGLLFGFCWPVLTDYINSLISSDIRATVLSTAGMGKNITFAMLAPLFGVIADKVSLSAAHISLGIFFMVSSVLCLVLLHRNRVI